LYYFKVAWFGVEEKITWEPASTLPQSLVDEFESGCTAEEVLHGSRYGVKSHTIKLALQGKLKRFPPQRNRSVHSGEKGTLCLVALHS